MCRREFPVVDAVASDYQGQVTFLAVAGRSDEASSSLRVGDWFSPERILWGYDDSLWGLYGVPYQPITFLISSDDVVVDMWFGALTEQEIRARIDALVAVG